MAEQIATLHDLHREAEAYRQVFNEIRLSARCRAPRRGTCAARGDYTDRHGHGQGFVVSQTGQGG